MEKQKLIQIILKDLGELNEIASGLSNLNGPSKLEMEIALTKSKLIYQEFEFLNEIQSLENSSKFYNILDEGPQLPFTSKMEQEKEEYGHQEQEFVISEAEQTHVEGPDFEEAESEPEPAGDEEQETTMEEYVQQEHQKENLEETVPDEDEIQQEEGDEDLNVKKTLGENFIKGKSLNDLLTESKTSDNKLPGSHINKMETAIGLNDRFQYTRELFDNNPELFRNTIQQLDQLENLHEAVAYLNTHFKWKKTDTSIQFAQLVKRRFSN